MNVSLTPRLEAFVKTRVETGLYASASEVVREALRLLEAQDRHREAKLKDLREDIQQGIDSGPPRDFAPDAFLARMHAKQEAASEGA
ncbi:MAG: type II toxin-antitoxin system ParD family antitoxin [Bacteroidota bacterium]